jgi:hypothetical protein
MLRKHDQSQEVIENKGSVLGSFGKTNWFLGLKKRSFWAKNALF